MWFRAIGSESIIRTKAHPDFLALPAGFRTPGSHVSLRVYQARYRGNVLPSHGSGLLRSRKSSIENLTSAPFSMRDSGSAFISQYERPELSVSSSAALTSADADFRCSAREGVPFRGVPPTDFLGRPRGRLPSWGVLGLDGVAIPLLERVTHT